MKSLKRHITEQLLLEKHVDLFDFCKDYLIDEIPEHEDLKIRGADLWMELTQIINNKCRVFTNDKDAENALSDWFDKNTDIQDWFWEQVSTFGLNKEDLCEIDYDEDDNFDLHWLKPANHICTLLVIYGVNNILNQCSFIIDNYDEEFTLDIRNIKKLVSEVKKIKMFDL